MTYSKREHYPWNKQGAILALVAKAGKFDCWHAFWEELWDLSENQNEVVESLIEELGNDDY